MRRAPLLLGVLVWVLVAAGVTVFWFADRAGGPAGTGYTGSYEPLPPAGSEAYRSVLFLSYDEWTVLWTSTHLVGAGLLMGGLLVLAGLVGWLIGRRRVPA
jgi:hypothetical protein